MRIRAGDWPYALAAGAGAVLLPAVAGAAPVVQLSLGESPLPEQVSTALKMIGVLTMLAVTPAVLVCTTCFLRIVVVFAFLRSALGVQNMPPQQVLVGLSLFLTVAIMAPVGGQLYDAGLGPYLDGELAAAPAFAAGSEPLKSFMIKQTRQADLALFYDVTQTPRPAQVESVNLRLLIPAFVISELRTAFEMGFLLFAPFLILDLVIASVLMSMGMVMLPPALISLPIKVMLFVLVDGWNLLVGSLVRSFA